MVEITYMELASLIWSNRHLFEPGQPGYSIDFYGDFYPDTGEKVWEYCIAGINFADSQVVIANHYGGGEPFIHDIGEDESFIGLACKLQDYFILQDLDSVWVDPQDI